MGLNIYETIIIINKAHADGHSGIGHNDLHQQRFQSHTHAVYMFPYCFALFLTNHPLRANAAMYVIVVNKAEAVI